MHNDIMTEIRNGTIEYDNVDKPDICMEEINRIIATLHKKKVTAMDRVPNKAMKKIQKAIGERYWQYIRSDGNKRESSPEFGR